MKRRLPTTALLLAPALLLGGYAAEPQPAESTQPEETFTQEQIDVVSGKCGLESPTPHTPPMGMDWGQSAKNPQLGLFSPFLCRLLFRQEVFMSAKEKTAGFLAEFRKFIAWDSVMSLAVGVIIGGASKGITDSLVNGILNPVFDIPVEDNEALAGLSTPLPGGSDLMLDSFLSAVLSFLVMTFVVFCIVKLLNRLHKEEEAVPPPPLKPSTGEALLTEIRDLLKE